MTRILDGIRVVDFGRFIAAPYCGMLLADFGADVIRVERREGGEDRAVGPVTASGAGGLYLNLNRNKRGVTLDLGSRHSRPIVERLVQTADVVLVNLPIKLTQKLGLDYDALCRIKPDVILVMVSAFGSDGPYANRVGFDAVAQAMSGAMSLTGFPHVPVRSVVPFADFGTALHAAFGAMAALFERERTGKGRLVEASLLETSVTFMHHFLAECAATSVRRAQLGNTSFYTAPNDTFRTSDAWIMVASVGGWMFSRWAELVGRPELADDPRFADDISRANHYETINDIMSQWCAERTTSEALELLSKARIPCGPIHNLEQVLCDPQVEARGMFERIGYEQGDAQVPLTRTAVRVGTDERAPLRRAPFLGEHTDDVLSELGFRKEEIAAFRRDDVI